MHTFYSRKLKPILRCWEIPQMLEIRAGTHYANARFTGPCYGYASRWKGQTWFVVLVYTCRSEATSFSGGKQIPVHVSIQGGTEINTVVSVRTCRSEATSFSGGEQIPVRVAIQGGTEIQRRHQRYCTLSTCQGTRFVIDTPSSPSVLFTQRKFECPDALVVSLWTRYSAL